MDEHPFDAWIGKMVTVILSLEPDEDGDIVEFEGNLRFVTPQGIFIEDDTDITFVPWNGMVYMEKAKE